MRTLRRFFRRLTSWATTRRDEERLRAEIEDHLALQTAENVRAGLSPLEARRQAVLKFGAVESTKESYRDQRGLPFLETLIQDTRHALRRLRLAPAFTTATILTLALGIGATTSIFTLAHAVLLKSLPVANPGELYRLGRETHCCYTAGYSQDKEFSLVSYDLYKYLRDNTRGFSELAAFPSLQLLFGVRRSGRPDPAPTYPGEFVSGNYFTMFGITAYAGRTLMPEDDRTAAPPVAVMSYRLWQQRYGADPSVIGSVFNVDDKPFTVVGIAPPGFFGDTLRNPPPDFYLPLNSEPFVESDADLNKYDTHWLELIGRLQPGARPASVEAEMRVALKQWLRAHWDEMSRANLVPEPRRRRHRQHARTIPPLASDPDDGDGVCAAHRLRQRSQPHARSRHGAAAADILEHGAGGANLASREAASHRKHPALVVWRRGGSGGRLCGHAPDPPSRIPLACRPGWRAY